MTDYEIDPRLIELLAKAGDEWGPLGVLKVAAGMWPDAYSVLITDDILAAERRGERLARGIARSRRSRHIKRLRTGGDAA